MSTAKAKLKTYVLLDHTKPTAPVYLRLNKDQRSRLDTRPVDHAYLRFTFLDPKDMKNKTFRLKLNCEELDLSIQAKEFNIPANAKFTQRERDAVRFQNGVLTTSNLLVQRFLESSPQFEEFAGERPDDIPRPLYKLLDKHAEMLSDNMMFKKRVRAANKITDLESLSEAQSLLIRLNGSSFKTPDTLEECQNLLANFLDDADEPMLDALLKEELNEDEKVTILIGKAINKGVLSFNEVADQVVRKVDGMVVKVKEISSEYDIEVRKRYFMEFLTSPKGALLLADIKKDVEGKSESEAGDSVDEEEVSVNQNVDTKEEYDYDSSLSKEEVSGDGGVDDEEKETAPAPEETKKKDSVKEPVKQNRKPKNK